MKIPTNFIFIYELNLLNTKISLNMQDFCCILSLPLLTIIKPYQLPKNFQRQRYIGLKRICFCDLLYRAENFYVTCYCGSTCFVRTQRQHERTFYVYVLPHFDFSICMYEYIKRKRNQHNNIHQHVIYQFTYLHFYAQEVLKCNEGFGNNNLNTRVFLA